MLGKEIWGVLCVSFHLEGFWWGWGQGSVQDTRVLPLFQHWQNLHLCIAALFYWHRIEPPSFSEGKLLQHTKTFLYVSNLVANFEEEPRIRYDGQVSRNIWPSYIAHPFTWWQTVMKVHNTLFPFSDYSHANNYRLHTCFCCWRLLCAFLFSPLFFFIILIIPKSHSGLL